MKHACGRAEEGGWACSCEVCMTDMVNAPPHYRTGDVECIDAIRAALGPEGFRAYCRGQVIKYVWRAPHKGAERQDYEKAAFYLNRLIEDGPS